MSIIEVLEPQRHLVGIEALRTVAEPGVLQLLDEVLKPGDLVVSGLGDRRHVTHQAV
jgi:hypothetical protein